MVVKVDISDSKKITFILFFGFTLFPARGSVGRENSRIIVLRHSELNTTLTFALVSEDNDNNSFSPRGNGTNVIFLFSLKS